MAIMNIKRQYYYGDISSNQINLAYNSIPFLELSLQSLIKFIQRTYDGA